jgi:zinc finger protein
MENSNREKLVELWEVVSKCPMCGGRLLTRDYRYNAPLVGDLIISVSKCEDCGYRHTDVFTMGSGEPRKVVYRVEVQGDDRALIVKSSTCRIEIPELGVTIEPGSYSQGYITTIEGIILDVKSIAQSICRDEEAPRDKCIEVLSLLEKAHNNEIPYTIVLYDYLGVCNIISDKKKPIYEKL